MMADFLLSNALHLALLSGGVFFSFLTARRPRMGFTVPAGLFTAAACLLALAAGRSPEELLTMVLIPTAVLLLAGWKGGSDP